MLLPAWFYLLLLPIAFWPVTLALIGLLAFVAVRTGGWPRRIAGGLAAALALLLLAGALVSILD